ncbi:MAG: hypothetical protein ACRDZ5_03765 [Acidimicrobiales bacterium]
MEERAVVQPGGDESSYSGLSSYRHCIERIRGTWPAFAARRRQRLRQGLYDAPVEKVAENILEDLLVDVLDWSLADVNLQIGRADVVLSALGIKRLVLEVKRPGTLTWNRPAVEDALDQDQRYAAIQRERPCFIRSTTSRPTALPTSGQPMILGGGSCPTSRSRVRQTRSGSPKQSRPSSATTGEHEWMLAAALSAHGSAELHVHSAAV